LSCVTTNIDVNFEDKEYMIPANVILNIYKNRKAILINDKVAIYKNSGNSTYIKFEMDNMVITTTVIDGNFPNYKQVIPKEFKTEVEVNKKQLTKEFIIAKEFSIAPTFKTLVDFKNDELRISTKGER